jgi:uncharacterized surface protein with fasciclin (FAS1) repeats
MKTTILKSFLFSSVILLAISCNNENEQSAATTNSSTSEPVGGGQASVTDDESGKDIVKIAVGSKDHSTLVTALQTAEYVDVLANAGPFTVFAPTNDAFAKLPEGTVESLLKPENKDKLRDILEYHVFVGGLKPEQLTDGRVLNMVNLQNTTIKSENGKMAVNTANILGSADATNGVVYVIDEVLLPPSK